MLLRQKLAGAAQPRLDFVEDEDDALARAKLANRADIARRRHEHAGLALDRLHEHRDRVWRDLSFKRFEISEWHDLEAAREGAEPRPCRWIGAETDDRHSAAVEIVGENDDLGLPLRHALDLITPFARHLDGGLHRFRAGVHRENLCGARQRAQFLAKRAKLVVAEGARGQREPRCLLDERFADFRMAMTLVDG